MVSPSGTIIVKKSDGTDWSEEILDPADIGAAIDSQVVKLFDDQTVSGVKTFEVSPVIVLPTLSDHAANKEYVDTISGSISNSVTITSQWKFNDITADADPGSGNFRLDNASEPSSNFIYIDDITDKGLDASIIISKLKGGDTVYIQNKKESLQNLLFEVSGNPIDGLGYWKIPVQSGTGIDIQDNKVCAFVFMYSRNSIEDHGLLTGLADDDHLQYVPADASRGFTSTVSGTDPTQNFHLSTKNYVDSVSGTLQTDIDLKIEGPSSSNDNNLVVFDGTAGKLVKDPLGIAVTSSGNLDVDLDYYKESRLVDSFVQADFTLGTDLVATNSELTISGATEVQLGVDFTVNSTNITIANPGLYVVTWAVTGEISNANTGNRRRGLMSELNRNTGDIIQATRTGGYARTRDTGRIASAQNSYIIETAAADETVAIRTEDLSTQSSNNITFELTGGFLRVERKN
ncbi:MAG: hypothetical protein DRQ40_00440 [Gammaproteobacteria bacterium]|nr:MAG: hypothetical protein DRQ40_00440 [Gammaproteobacteria bacterium]